MQRNIYLFCLVLIVFLSAFTKATSLRSKNKAKTENQEQTKNQLATQNTEESGLENQEQYCRDGYYGGKCGYGWSGKRGCKRGYNRGCRHCNRGCGYYSPWDSCYDGGYGRCGYSGYGNCDDCNRGGYGYGYYPGGGCCDGWGYDDGCRDTCDGWYGKSAPAKIPDQK